MAGMTSGAAPSPQKRPGGRKPPKKITPDYLNNAGLAYLERFPTSAAHFRRVMMRKVDRSCRFHADQDRAACAAMVDDVIGKFRTLGFLNDDAYVRGMVNSLRRRGTSAAGIKAKLAAKGMAGDAVARALSAHTDDNGTDDLGAALILARRKKIGPFRPPSREENRDKELAALARAGFSYDTAAKALSMDADEANERIRTLS